MGMVAACSCGRPGYGVRLPGDDLWIATPMVAGFLALGPSPHRARRAPLIGALLIGVIAVWPAWAFTPGPRL